MVFVTRKALNFFILFFILSLSAVITDLFVMLLYFILALLVILVIADIFYVPSKMKISINRINEKYLSIGIENRIEINVVSHFHRAVRMEIRDLYPESFDVKNDTISLLLSPDTAASGFYHVIPLKKGDYMFGEVCVRVFGVLGLSGRQYKYAVEEPVKVYPDIIGLKKYLNLMTKNRLDESGFKSATPGGENEFDFLREYQPGDSYRYISWKATAKRNFPVTRINRKEIERTVFVMLDCGRMMTTKYGILTKLDHCVNTALILAASVINNNDRFGLLAFDDRMISYIKPANDKNIYHKIMSSLYKVSSDYKKSDYAGAYKFVKKNVNGNSIIFIFTELYDKTVSKELIEMVSLLRKNHIVKIISFDEIEKLSVGYNLKNITRYTLQLMEISERKQIIFDLKAKGIDTICVNAENITVKTVNRYLSI